MYYIFLIILFLHSFLTFFIINITYNDIIILIYLYFIYNIFVYISIIIILIYLNNINMILYIT